MVDVLDAEAQPDSPEWPAKGSTITEPRASELQAHYDGEEPIEPAPSKAERAEFLAFTRARKTCLAARSPMRGRVPAFKFSDNGGWRVTPVEARIIARGIEKLLTDDDQASVYFDVLDVDATGAKAIAKTLREFARFNLRAAETGGYTVE